MSKPNGDTAPPQLPSPDEVVTTFASTRSRCCDGEIGPWLEQIGENWAGGKTPSLSYGKISAILREAGHDISKSTVNDHFLFHRTDLGDKIRDWIRQNGDARRRR